ncbi:general stress protein [Exiguobacterium sp. B2(2022)]|uniref:general stress protein n=1 Tax=Exiguobacterium sp. B2(2022) TaxID=2992755 RepID=UPI00237A4ABC|nr:general stress protein [Exiguobacterium sp. B2(2022)]MDE0562143.1 general stress protein [Exiguobacterium sp. B2(2022)]
MSEKRFVGTYDTKESLLSKMNELNENGYDEGELYVVTEQKDAVHVLKHETNVNVENGDASWLDNLQDDTSQGKDMKQALHDLGISDDEVEQAHAQLKQGGYVLVIDEPDTGFNDGRSALFEGHEANAVFGEDEENQK